MFSDSIEVSGRPFELVCVRRTSVAVYRGPDVYLRLGPATAPEVDVQQRMLDQGYPVADILEVGTYAGTTYVIESSLGPETLGDLFDRQVGAGGRVSDQDFSVFADVLLRCARAQVSAERQPWQDGDLADFLGVDRAAENLPDLAASIRAAFEEALAPLRDLPGALQHDDLHPFNICERGVIDLEGVAWAVAGYDVTTAVLDATLDEARWENHELEPAWFTDAQIQGHLDALDDEFRRASLPLPSGRIDAFLICRAICVCSRIPRDAAAWNARRNMLARLLPAFLDSGRVPLALAR